MHAPHSDPQVTHCSRAKLSVRLRVPGMNGVVQCILMCHIRVMSWLCANALLGFGHQISPVSTMIIIIIK